MKRLALLLFPLLVLFSFPVVRAEAEEAPAVRYAVAATADVWFYAAENEESGLFLLPYTYYVKVLREGPTFCAVQYQDDVSPYRALNGYCKTAALTFVDFVPERPFPRREISVTYTLGGDTPLGGGAFDRIERTFVYYGASYSGTARYYYVYADGAFGYIPGTQEVIFELNTDYLEPAVEIPPPEEEPEPESASPLQIVLICVAALGAVVCAVLVLKGKRSAREPSEF